MNLLYFGNSPFGIPSLDKILQSKHNLLGVITNPPKKSGRGRGEKLTPIHKWASLNNIPTYLKDDINEGSFIDQLKLLNADLFIVIAYKILPPKIFNIPKFGTMNLHASLLPNLRGAAPIQRALLNGNKETGITTFLINEKIDDGEIIGQLKFKINDNDNFGDLHETLSNNGADLVIESIEAISKETKGKIFTTKRSYAKKIIKKELQIDWDNTAQMIFNKIRAFAPYPGSYTWFNNKRIKIFNAKISQKSNLLQNVSPGFFTIQNSSMLVKTLDRDVLLEILEIQVEGGNKITPTEFYNGHIKNIHSNQLIFEKR